jgi:hypothetical protein
MMSMGNVIAGMPVESDVLLEWFDHFGVNLGKNKHEMV